MDKGDTDLGIDVVFATVPTFNLCTNCVGSQGTTARPITERSFDSQATSLIDVLGSLF